MKSLPGTIPVVQTATERTCSQLADNGGPGRTPVVGCEPGGRSTASLAEPCRVPLFTGFRWRSRRLETCPPLSFFKLRRPAKVSNADTRVELARASPGPQRVTPGPVALRYG